MGSITIDADVDDIISKLTLEEKVSLLAGKDWWRTPTIKRDGVFVPHIKATDGPNGARGESYVSGIRAACFPCGTSLGSTFDVDLLFEFGKAVAKEAITKSANVLLAPTMNVIRSPLGGRNYETYSEDPFVLGKLAAAYINGCQSMGIAATPKHFVANEAENRRNYLNVVVDEQTLREIYLFPFQLALKLSKPLCFMTSYNRVNGTYVSDDRRFVEDILRREWGFDGLVVSDWMGTYSTDKSICAGVDLEMPGPPKWRGKKLIDAIKNGLVSESVVNLSAWRVIALAKTLGLFENPDEPPEREVEDEERDNFIRDTAAEGMVLLKNDAHVLPLRKGANVALIGHLAQVVSLGGGGSARVDALHAVTPIEGFKELGIEHKFEPGVPVYGALPHADPAIVSYPSKWESASIVPSGGNVKLQWFNGSSVGGNLAFEEDIQQAEYMIKEAWPHYLDTDYCTRMEFDVTPRTTGKHTFSIISTGKAICYINGEVAFIREQETDLQYESFYFFKSKLERRFSYSMVAGRRYSLVLESWATDPKILNSPPLNGRMHQGSSLRFFEYVDIQQRISRAASLAAESDYAVVCVGNTNEIESEGYDRDTMDLSADQYTLINAVAASNSKTIVVNFSGAPVTMTQFVDNVPAILQAWFPGQECGHSVARVLAGIVNPCGRLPLSWPRQLQDNPSYGNFPVDDNDVLRYAEGLSMGYRHYDRNDVPNPLFPFGFGLSYTTFEVQDAQLLHPVEVMGDGIEGQFKLSCSIQNTGDRPGKAVVQFYIQYPKVSTGLTRPRKELKAFQKISLLAGETGYAEVAFDKYSISFYDAAKACWRIQKGQYMVHVGLSSTDIVAHVPLSVTQDYEWTGI
ncbi:glycoside hydrolase superfamily [Xylogone sp. PMI_703]|nr:glycoside hydrolase superfamily [Xylogone sp. PMI_703]